MDAQQNQINLGKENMIPLQVMVSCLPFIIIPRSIWDHCPISSWINNNFFECMWMVSGSGFFVTSCTLEYWLVPKRNQISLSAQFSCLWVEFCFNAVNNIYKIHVITLVLSVEVEYPQIFYCAIQDAGWTYPLPVPIYIYFASKSC